MCQRNAMEKGSVKVIYKGVEYFPDKLLVWFDDKGETQNTAVLLSVKARSHTYALLKDVSKIG